MRVTDKFCPNCNKINIEGARFCSSCNYPLICPGCGSRTDGSSQCKRCNAILKHTQGPDASPGIPWDKIIFGLIIFLLLELIAVGVFFLINI